MAQDASSPPPVSAPLGLAGWMRRVLEECDRAKSGLEAEAVHDLRVALRRCRSMTDSLGRIDPDPDWRRLKKTAKSLFRSLGELRDVQVMPGWVQRLSRADDPLRQRLLEKLEAREAQLRGEGHGALEEFDRKEWKRLGRRLPRRAARIPVDGPVYETIAIERWDEATWLHDRAVRSRSRVGWHRLRIGVKRFRYVVENFLPSLYAAWGDDLKRLQDLLGEVHDLDLLWAELQRLRPMPSAAEREAWRVGIESERRERLAEYLERSTGRRSLWLRWRAELPEVDRLRAASTQRLATWASFLDPDRVETSHVSHLALELFDDLARLELHETFADPETRRLLEVAALVRNVGRSRRGKGSHKGSAALVRQLVPPPGFSAQEMEMVALGVRYHRGAEPREAQLDFAALDEQQRRTVAALAAVLRLARALGRGPERSVSRIELEPLGDVVQVWATGWRDDPKRAARIAEAKHLLETVTGRAFLIRPRVRRPRLVVPRGAGAVGATS